MDEELLTRLIPSLLIFSSIGFSLVTIAPELRNRIKDKFSLAVRKREQISGLKYFSFNFYLATMKITEIIGYLYLMDSWLVLTLPFIPQYKVSIYGITLCIMTLFIVSIVVTALFQIKKTLAHTRLLSRIAQKIKL